MPKVEVWQCPHTEKLFPLSEERQYRNHLKKLSRDRIRAKELILSKSDFDRWLEQKIEHIDSIRSIEQFAMENAELLFRRHYYNDGYHHAKGLKLLDIDLKARYSENVSNSHCAPRNGVRNWHRKDDLPKGYSGFHGQITFVYSRDHSGFLSSMWDNVGIHTGSGGYNGTTYKEHKDCYVLSYSVSLFLDDWPGIKKVVHDQYEEYRKETMMDRIAGNRVSNFSPII